MHLDIISLEINFSIGPAPMQAVCYSDQRRLSAPSGVNRPRSTLSGSAAASAVTWRPYMGDGDTGVHDGRQPTVIGG